MPASSAEKSQLSVGLLSEGEGGGAGLGVGSRHMRGTGFRGSWRKRREGRERNGVVVRSLPPWNGVGSGRANAKRLDIPDKLVGFCLRDPGWEMSFLQLQLEQPFR